MKLKSAEEVQILRAGGKRLASIVHEVGNQVKPGITAVDLDKTAALLIEKMNGKPAFKGYNGFPAVSCISINEGVVHGIPDKDYRFQEGDIVGVDIGLAYKGLYTDMAVTIAVGHVNAHTQKLISVTKQALDLAINQAKLGNTIGDIGHAVQSFVEKNEFSVVRTLVGHGVGFEVHEEPKVPNFGKPGTGLTLESGMVLAIEPMVNIGGFEVKTLDDGWTIVTLDGSLSAHFEHTIAITANGPEVLTSQ